MSARSDGHDRRETIAKARRFLPSVSSLPAKERTRQLAKHLGICIRYATRVRVQLEREAHAEALASAESAAPTPADFWKTHDDALVDLIAKASALYDRAVKLKQLNAACSALKQLHAFSLDRATWNGARPVEVESAGTGDVHLHLHLGPDEDEDDGDEPAS